MSSPGDRITVLQPSQVVRSPDAVALHLPLAGPTSRMLAYAADAIALQTTILLLVFLLFLVFPALSGIGTWLRDQLPGLAQDNPSEDELRAVMLAVVAFWVILSTFAEILWFVTWETISGGGSLGKKLLGLRVMEDGGRPLSIGASLARNFLRVVDVLPSSYLTGLVAMLVSRDAKRLGDLAAGTVVVRLDRPQAAPPLVDGTDADVARFRLRREQLERLGDEEMTLVRQTLRRLETLPAEQAEEFLNRAVDALRARLGIQEDVPARDREALLRALWMAKRTR